MSDSSIGVKQGASPARSDSDAHGKTALADLSDEDLMDRYCAGDIQAFNLLFQRFTPRIVRFLTNMVGPTHAKDITQVTFLKIHENRHRYRAGAHVPAWFFAIARNSALDYLRSAPKRREVFGTEIDPGKEGPKRDLFRDAQIREAIAKLSKDQQQVIMLHWYGEMTFDEVAAAVGATSSAVRVRAHRAYEKLRTSLKALGIELKGDEVPDLGSDGGAA